MDNKKPEDCFACKVTSICCLFSIGCYLIYHSRQPTQKYKHAVFSIGLGSIALGIGEIFDKSPFRNNKEINKRL